MEAVYEAETDSVEEVEKLLVLVGEGLNEEERDRLPQRDAVGVAVAQREEVGLRLEELLERGERERDMLDVIDLTGLLVRVEGIAEGVMLLLPETLA